MCQAVRLPKDFRFQGDEVVIRRIGSAVVLLPKSHPWAVLVESLGMFSDDFPGSRENQPRSASGSNPCALCSIPISAST
ncbi:MAG: antitoxin [Vulcanimicrobiaceae bacterium]